MIMSEVTQSKGMSRYVCRDAKKGNEYRYVRGDAIKGNE